ncbi:chaperonin GroEL [Aquisalimonas sp.]|uniref:chaperonin GroEL n=1 Tax=unclassified Aquisalimonas TaxID=2644645 RepID=UPI0025C5AE02|nr:chaperonin GroEL [Aquisalimonas sp.]
MTAKRVLFRSAAREKVLSGATQLTDAVRVTLGPKSKAVLIQKRWGEPLVCDDGVTIARELELEDPEENLGVQVLRQAAEKTGDLVGDGTSTATVLAHAIFSEGLRNVVAGASAIDLKRGLERGLRAAIDDLASRSRKLSTRAERAQVATLSAHGNKEIGELVAEAIEKVGEDGVITVEESRTTETVLEVVEGLRFDRGYISPYFVTEPTRMEAILEESSIFLTDRKLSNPKELVPLLEQVAEAGCPVLVIADDVAGEALATLIVNHLRGILHCVAVKAPGFGDRRRAMLGDLAAVTGATVVSDELGQRLQELSLSQLGRAARVVVDSANTTIIGGGGSADAIQGRVQQIRRELDKSTSDYDREKLEERIARLSGGVAVIRAGAPSETEMKSRKEALDDAISATKAAVAEGIVAGGGLALVRCTPAISAEAERTEGDERTGLRILQHALQAPARQIAENSAVDGGVVIERMLASDGNLGLDAATGRYLDLMEAGIVDPTKVVRVALENAVSAASVLLLTEATMTEIVARPDHDRDTDLPV